MYRLINTRLCKALLLFALVLLFISQLPMLSNTDTPESEQTPNALPRTPVLRLSSHNFSFSITNDLINGFQVHLPHTLSYFKNPCWVEDVPEGFTYNNTFYGGCLFSRRDKTKIKAGPRKQFPLMEGILRGRREDGHGWRMRCFPYFFLLGVTKSGTTSLFSTFVRHIPEFVHGALKEYHFWEFKREPPRGKSLKCPHESQLRFSSYLDGFDLPAEVIRSHVEHRDGQEYHPYITGDFTPSTLTTLFNWQKRVGNEGLLEPRYTNAHYIQQLRPETKFIIIMRDPVERLFSNFRMKARRHLERHKDQSKYQLEKFDVQVQQVIDNFLACEANFSTRICAYSSERFDIAHMLIRGLYDVFVGDWLDVFPRNQFLFIMNEDYQDNRLNIIRNIISFLGLSPLTPERIQDIERETKAINQYREANSNPHEINPEIKKSLQDFYRPHNNKLAERLNDERFKWNY